MSGDILHHRPARPTTILPGHWLVDLPPDTPIQIIRYRARDQIIDTREQTLLENPLDTCWRDINSKGNGAVKDILSGGCATVIVSGDNERELWVFSTTHNNLDETHSLEHVLPGPDTITPADLLHCTRHGSTLSCLSRPSTSQRPLKSCDVRFQPQGSVKEVWERLGMAILEKAEWKRGKRVMAKSIDIQLLPDLNGLMLKVRPKKMCPPNVPSASLPKIQIIQPLGIPALPIGPYHPSAREALTLGPSYEQVLGPNWKDGQSAARLDAQLAGRPFYEYTTLWIPESASTIHSRPSFDKVAEWKKGQGILTIWPTHLLDNVPSHDVRPGLHSRPRDTPVFESSMDLLGIASGLFDVVSTLREPVEQLTPPGDASLEEETDTTQPAGELSPILDTWPNPAVNDHDDLEDLFASPASSHPSHADLHFEMFGQEDRKNSYTNNADLIDYDDIVMSSPPPEYGGNVERRASVREVMGDEGTVDEVGPGLVTDDDFNFFDSPPDPDAPVDVVETDPPAAVLMPTPDSLSVPTVEPVLESPFKATTVPQPSSPIIETPVVETIASPAPVPPISPLAEVVQPVAVRTQPRSRAQDLVPYDFAPLELAHSRHDRPYSLPSPAYSPPNLNLDLIERLKPPTKKEKVYDYTLAWHLDAPDSDSEIDEYTRPPTPLSDYNDSASPIDRSPTPPLDDENEHGHGQSKYLYQGHWCLAAGLLAMLSQPTRPAAVYVPWGVNWGDDPPSAVLDSPIATLSRKRKQPKPQSTTGDLSTLAKRIIQNRHARPTSRRTPDAKEHSLFMAEQGISLAELTSAGPGGDGLEASQHALSPCSVHTGFQGHVIQLSIASLRYWSELGLQSLSGPKNIKAAIVTRHQEDEGRARGLADSLRNVYTSLNLGTVEIDKSFGRDGFRCFDTDVSLADWVRSKDDDTVMFVFLRDSVGSVVPLLRHMPETRQDEAIHVLPLTLEARDLSDAAYEVYNSISRQAHLVHQTDEPAPWYNYPSFTMARTDRPKPQLSMDCSLPFSYDVLGSYRWIHAAYHVDEKTGLTTIFVADQEGDDWVIKVDTDAAAASGQSWMARAHSIWDTVSAFADTAATSWRLTICSLGIMVPEELQAWRSIFTGTTHPATIIMCDSSSSNGHTHKSRPGPSNVPLGMLNDPTTMLVDESLAGTYSTFSQRQPIPSGDGLVYTASSILLSLASSNLEYNTSTYHVMYHRPAPVNLDGDQEKELANEMYKMACWGRMRFGLDALPAHLAALVVVDEASSAGEVGFESDDE